MTKAPTTIMYANVVSRVTISISLMNAPLNDLEIKLDHILNGCVQAPVTEKVWSTLGSQFGMDVGNTTVIVRALHDLKSAKAALRSHLAKCMKSLVYTPCKANLILVLKLETRAEDGVDITPTYFVMGMTFFVSIAMQMLYFNSYTSFSLFIQVMSVLICTKVQDCIEPGYITEYRHG